MTNYVRTCYGDYMKNEITVTELRSNIYAIIDEVIRTGEPVLINRNKKLVEISVPKKKSINKKKKVVNDLSKIVPIPDLLTEDPEFYRSIDWESLIGPPSANIDLDD